MLNRMAGSAIVASCAIMGLQVWGQPPIAAVSIVLNWSGMYPGRRLRPSHSAFVAAKQSPADLWDRHQKRWGGERIVPMPFRRGIPFRGDVLGSEWRMPEALTQPTG